MAIRSKPQQSAPAADERAVEAFIGKGGGVSAETAAADEVQKLQLRLPTPITGRIDRVREARYPNKETRPSRHTWFIEAFLEKLEREEGQAL